MAVIRDDKKKDCILMFDGAVWVQDFRANGYDTLADSLSEHVIVPFTLALSKKIASQFSCKADTIKAG